jgi:16S rRNA (cytosine1402-N4)-methyltransferase
MTELRHEPVMMDELMAVFPLEAGAVAVDGTLGMAGHSLEMCRRIAPGGVLIGFDWDSCMLDRAAARLEESGDVEVRLHHSDFRALPIFLKQDAEEMGRELNADAILLDLGVSSIHLDDPERGFSFMSEGPLDMRMDRSKGEPAAALLNRASAGEIEQILWDHGDERWAKKIAHVIVERRKSQPLRKTSDLTDCVLAAIPAKMRDKRIHPATRTFQAVRIAVNGEIDELQAAIEDAGRCLAPGGVMAVLAYHSGEDRQVKRAMRSLAKESEFEEVNRKPVGPTEEEARRNPRSRSAKMRSLRRVKGDQG